MTGRRRGIGGALDWPTATRTIRSSRSWRPSEEDGPIQVDADLLPAGGIRTELDGMVDSSAYVPDHPDVCEIEWQAGRKHCDLWLETWPVRSDWIEARLAELEGGS